jgi:hypothetical protein
MRETRNFESGFELGGGHPPLIDQGGKDTVFGKSAS